jgi:hypothetical protein
MEQRVIFLIIYPQVIQPCLHKIGRFLPVRGLILILMVTADGTRGNPELIYPVPHLKDQGVEAEVDLTLGIITSVFVVLGCLITLLI